MMNDDSLLDLNALAKKVSGFITSRPYLEANFMTQDDGLIGLILLCTSIMKHSLPFKESNEGQVGSWRNGETNS